MSTKVIVWSLLVVVVVAVGLYATMHLADGRAASARHSETAAKTVYTCPMHPSVRSDRPGACPICGMALVRSGPDTELSDHELAALSTVTLSPSQQALANVATSTVRRTRLQKEIRAVGIIEPAEPRVQRISARFGGRIERLYVEFTGQSVRKGDPVVDMYSPEAISAQKEYVLARTLSAGGRDAGEADTSIAREAREKLRRWGFTDQQVSDLERDGVVRELVTVRAPMGGTVLQKMVSPQQYVGAGEDLYEVADLSTVWMIADVYEPDIPWVAIGQAIEARSGAYPGQRFIGTVAFVSPTVDPMSRTVRVRTQFPNRDGRLRLQMFVDAVLKVDLPEGLAVPVSAVLSSGGRSVVWVQKEEGVFVPRDVTVGERAGDFVRVLRGLSEGETIASSGGYLIDSESQLQAAGTGSHDKHE